MKTYDEMIKQTGSILFVAADLNSDVYYNMAQGYAEAIALIFDQSYLDTWNLVRDDAKRHMLEKVENGDLRAQIRWDKFWNGCNTWK